VDFREADLQYTDLKQRHTNGILTDDEFDAQLKHIMVQDSEGRWWAKHRETGEWHYDDDGVWRPGTPPDPDYRRGTATGEPTTHTPPEEPEVRRQQPRQGSRTATAEINWGQIAWPVFLSGIIPSLLNFFLPGNLFGVFVVGSLTYSGAFLLFHLIPLAFGYWAGRVWPGQRLQAYSLLGLLAGFIEVVVSWGITFITPFWRIGFFDILLALLTAILFTAGAYFAGFLQRET